MKALHLVLKAEYYDSIETGEKPEEYRDIVPHWITRLVANPVFNKKGEIIDTKPVTRWTLEELERQHRDIVTELWTGNAVIKDFRQVVFRRGYRKGAPTMAFRIRGIIVGKGNPEWGAPDRNVFIIKLGGRI